MNRLRHALLPALTAAAVFTLAEPAFAVQPDEILPDAAQESRARSISAGLRCLVCQNQSIDDSDAPLAKDLRLIVRERIKAGDNDAAVVDYVVARYGDYVLLKPPLKPSTYILWLSPLALLGFAIWLGRKVLKPSSGPSVETAPLTDAERAKLEKLLAKDADRDA